MKMIELLNKLRKKNIKIWIEDDSLRFNGPKEGLNQELLKGLHQHEYEILSLLKDAKKTDYPKKLQVVTKAKKEHIPLSFAQNRLWFMEQLKPGNSFYNIQDVRKITGPLNLKALEKSIQEIVNRHAGLRTTFAEENEQPVQIITDQMKLPFRVINLCSSTKDESEKEAEKIIYDDASTPFDLSKCLIRATVIHHSSEEYILILSMHHIISDGWSMGILFKEMEVLYEAFCNDQPSPLPDLNCQYSDYSIWQHDQFQEEKLQNDLLYWKNQLKNAPNLIELPTDFSRPAIQNYKGSLYSFWLSGADIEELEMICQENGSTLFMGLLTIYNILLHRYTGQEDIIVGTVTANRNSIELEEIIGFFVNTLPIRNDLSNDPTFEELLMKVRNSCLGAYAHQEVPFEMLVDQLKPERNLSYTPIVQTLCILQSASDTLQLPGLKVSRVEVDYDTAKFDLTFAFEKDADGMQCHIEFNNEIFTENTIVKLTKSFQNILKSSVATPNKRISELQIISKRDRKKVVETWNEKNDINYSNLCIHEWFEKQVENRPDSIAIVSTKESISYQQLNERANQLAHFLRENGVTTEVKVGICVERTIEMLVGIIGILKAGGTYVPIDSNYPEERKQYILQDSNAQLLLTNEHLVDSFHEDLEIEILTFEKDRKIIKQKSTSNIKNISNPSNLAYIIYTSGSTGKPKGVMVSHSNVTRLFLNTEKCYQFNSDDKWTLFHSFAFDFSVWEIWGALLYGGQLVIVPYWTARSIDEFYELVAKQKITVLNQTPSAFYQFIEADKELNMELSLRTVIFGGESLETNKLNNWFNKHGDCKPALVNMYGITETTVHVTHQPINHSQTNEKNMIGKRISDLELYILDENMEPVPIGVVGEIHVGGAGVARGYNNRPRLTAEKFVPNIFSKEKGSRLYKTGDLARFLDSGGLEYLGRIDHQVKIRGFRIELEEIQRVMEEYPLIQQTVVVVHTNEDNDIRIVAYFTLENGQSLDLGALKDYLKNIIPNYMIPSWFIEMKKFPLSQNGKIDKKRLPNPSNETRISKHEMVLPRTEIEMMLSDIWKETLKISKVSVKDNFFELGGNSFSAIQFIRKVEALLGKTVSTAAIFQYPTIEGIAKMLEKESNNNENDVIVELHPSENKQTLSLVHPVGGNIFCYTGLLKLLEPNYQVYGFKAPGIDGNEKPITSIRELAKRYVSELLLTNRTEHTILGWSMGGIVAFEMGIQIYDQLGYAPKIIMIDSWSKDISSMEYSGEIIFKMFIEDLQKSSGAEIYLNQMDQGMNELERLNYVLTVIRKAGIFSTEFKVEHLKYMLDVYSANLNALNGYVPTKRYPGEIVVLRAENGDNQDKTLGWKDWSQQEVSVKTIPGDHYTIFNKPGINILADEIRKSLGDSKIIQVK
ncbi:amino acid adenylation domain-containing protein [Bacillus sp. R86525]|uniref:amino acid adenylation domain-containing protein n=1 Tax=Bacillus sp. R86525 TaxID=3101709 RepID=UPI00366E14B1